MKLNHQRWQEIEKDQLSEAYRQNVPLKVMAAFFGRSPTAVNKALNRYKIRPHGLIQRGVKRGSSHSTYVSLKDFRRQMTAYSSQISSSLAADPSLNIRHNPSQNLQKAKNQSDTNLNEVIAKPVASKTIMQARFDSPLAGIVLPELDPDEIERQNVLAQARPWLSLEALIEKLKGYNVSVLIFRLQCPDNTETLRFKVDGFSMSAAELLIKANKIFLARGEGTVYVDEITL